MVEDNIGNKSCTNVLEWVVGQVEDQEKLIEFAEKQLKGLKSKLSYLELIEVGLRDEFR